MTYSKEKSIVNLFLSLVAYFFSFNSFATVRKHNDDQEAHTNTRLDDGNADNGIRARGELPNTNS